MRKQNARQVWDDEQIARAVGFTTSRFQGRGVYDTRRFDRLQDALADAAGDRRALVYAVTPEGWTIHFINGDQIATETDMTNEATMTIAPTALTIDAQPTITQEQIAAALRGTAKKAPAKGFFYLGTTADGAILGRSSTRNDFTHAGILAGKHQAGDIIRAAGSSWSTSYEGALSNFVSGSKHEANAVEIVAVALVDGATFRKAMGISAAGKPAAKADAPAKAPRAPRGQKRDAAKTAAIAKAAKPAKAAKAPKAAAAPKALGLRAQRAADAAAGKLPNAPDFSAETHKRYRAKLAELVALISTGDVAAVRAYPINVVGSSSKAMDSYRNLAVIALEAVAK